MRQRKDGSEKNIRRKSHSTFFLQLWLWRRLSISRSFLFSPSFLFFCLGQQTCSRFFHTHHACSKFVATQANEAKSNAAGKRRTVKWRVWKCLPYQLFLALQEKLAEAIWNWKYFLLLLLLVISLHTKSTEANRKCFFLSSSSFLALWLKIECTIWIHPSSIFRSPPPFQPKTL